MANYKELMNVFYGEYSEDYCKRNGLFVAYNSEKQVIAKTKQIVAYAQDLIAVDLGFIFGSWETINEELEDENEANPAVINTLQNILNANEWADLKRLFVFQGMALGTTAMRVGRDAEGNVKMDVVDLTRSDLVPIYGDDEEIEGWKMTTKIKTQENDQIIYKDLVEIFTADEYRRELEGSPVMVVANQYDKPWLFVAVNSKRFDPRFESWQGTPEWDTVQELIDEINSIHSRISRIEDIYANPRFLVSGANEAQLKNRDNVWFAPTGGDIRILEYQGNVMGTMLQRIELLERTLKGKTPEYMFQDIGAQGSGYALRLRLQSLEKKIAQLKNAYFPVFEDLFSLLYEMETGIKKTFSYQTDYIVPKDTENLLKELATLYGMGIVSLRTIAEEMGYNYDQEVERLDNEYGAEARTRDDQEDDDVAEPVYP